MSTPNQQQIQVQRVLITDSINMENHSKSTPFQINVHPHPVLCIYFIWGVDGVCNSVLVPQPTQTISTIPVSFIIKHSQTTLMINWISNSMTSTQAYISSLIDCSIMLVRLYWYMWENHWKDRWCQQMKHIQSYLQAWLRTLSIAIAP